MRIIIKRQRILGVLRNWKKQYPNNDRTDERHKNMTKELEKLDFNNAKESEVIKIIGNDSWTCLDCAECKKNKDILIVFLEENENEYESNTCELCLDCLGSGESLIKDFANAVTDEEVKE